MKKHNFNPAEYEKLNNVRRKIVKNINKKQLANVVGNNSEPINNFFCKNSAEHCKNKKIKYNKKLYIAYNTFFPNQFVANEIANSLEKNGFNVELVPYEYSEDNKLNFYNLKLVLNYFEYIDCLYFYESLYFKTVMKKSKIYFKLLDSYKKNSNSIVLWIIQKMFKYMYIKEPLVGIKSLYLTNSKTNGFSFLELNFENLSKR